jgi:hypothetical protein
MRMITIPKKLLIAVLLTTIVAIALGAVYFSFSCKENTMEQTYAESTNIPPADAPAPVCAADTNVPPTDTPAPTYTGNTTIPPIDASAPTHTETATFAMG